MFDRTIELDVRDVTILPAEYQADNSYDSFVSSLQQATHLKRITLRNCQVPAWDTLVTLIPTLPSLSAIDLSNCVLGPVVAQQLAVAIKDNSRRIKDIALAGTMIQNEGAEAIINAILVYQNCADCHISLNLSGCGLTDVCCTKVRDLLSRTSVTSLCLRGNSLTDNFMSEVSAALGACQSLLELDISDNNFGDDAVEGLIDAFGGGEHVVRLEKLGLSRLAVSPAGVLSMIDLARMCVNLHELDLSRNEVDSNTALTCSTALNDTPKLVTLNLNSCKLGDQGVRHIADFVATAENLVEISLCDNNISVVGVTDLATAIKHNSTLQRINVDENSEIGNAGVIALTTALLDSWTLQHLSLADTGLGPDGMQGIRDLLCASHTISSLALGRNEALLADATSTKTTALCLAEGLLGNNSLVTLNLQELDFQHHEEAALLVVEGVLKHAKLKQLEQLSYIVDCAHPVSSALVAAHRAGQLARGQEMAQRWVGKKANSGTDMQNVARRLEMLATEMFDQCEKPEEAAAAMVESTDRSVQLMKTGGDITSLGFAVAPDLHDAGRHGLLAFASRSNLNEFVSSRWPQNYAADVWDGDNLFKTLVLVPVYTVLLGIQIPLALLSGDASVILSQWNTPIMKFAMHFYFYVTFLAFMGYAACDKHHAEDWMWIKESVFYGYAGTLVIFQFQLMANAPGRGCSQKLVYHFSSVWNILDFFSLFLLSDSFVARWSYLRWFDTNKPNRTDWSVYFVAAAIVLCYLRALEFVQVSQSMGHFIVSAIDTVKTVAVLFTCIGTFLISFPLSGTLIFGTGEQSSPMFKDWKTSFWTFVGMAFGDFDEAQDEIRLQGDSFYGHIFLSFFLVAVTLFSTTLFIAVVVRQYNERYEANMSHWLFVRTKMVLTYESQVRNPFAIPPLNVLYIMYRVGVAITCQCCGKRQDQVSHENEVVTRTAAFSREKMLTFNIKGVEVELKRRWVLLQREEQLASQKSILSRV